MNEEQRKEWRKKISIARLASDYVPSAETRNKMRMAKLGKPGHSPSRETLRKLSETQFKNANGYHTVHLWVKKWKGKATICQACGNESEDRVYHWANVDHKYRMVLSDYISMCVPCHRHYDKRFRKAV